MRNYALLYLNGKRLEIGPEHGKMMLADYLRYSAGLTGTKIVCAEGDCGACTVLRAFAGFGQSKFQYLPINSCIVTVSQMDGSSLVTVDALSKGDELSPEQSAMMNCHGSQCGFCTPGFVMALKGLVEKKLETNSSNLTEKDAKNALTGNLCRCTGYQAILEAATSIDLKKCESAKQRFSSLGQVKDLRSVLKKPMHLKSDDYHFVAPVTLAQATKELIKNPGAKLLAAATDLGVVHNKGVQRLQSVISLHLIPELYEIQTVKPKKKTEARQIRVGARVSFSELRHFVRDLVPEFAEFLDLFASPQIKNLATLIGNVATASPIADTPPFLLVGDSVVEILGPKGKRSLKLEDFFLKYRTTALKKNEIIVAIRFAIPSPGELLCLRKVSERKDLDISAVNFACRLTWADEEQKAVKQIRIALGGVSATTLRLKKTEALLSGQILNEKIKNQALKLMQSEIRPMSDLRGSAAFRRVVAENLLKRFLSEAAP